MRIFILSDQTYNQKIKPANQSMTQRYNFRRQLQSGQLPFKPSCHRHTHYHPAFRAAISLVLIGAIIGYRLLWPSIQVNNIKDAYHIFAESLNRQMVTYQDQGSAYEGNSNPLSATGQVLIGIGQVIMDCWTITICIVWTSKTKNGRVLVGIGSFYLIRSFVFLNIQFFPFPQNLVWRSPGFFSLTVPYDHTRDFFYSGHTGSLTLIFLEFLSLKQYLVCFLIGLSWIFMINMLLITKVHYTTDIVGGLVFAIWLYWMGGKAVDKMLSFPYTIVSWIYNKICHKDSQESLLQAQIARKQQANPQNRKLGQDPGISNTMKFSSFKLSSK